jgi:hypothetical protein
VTERVSWLKGVLPYLGDDRYVDMAGAINTDRSWRDPENLRIGRIVVPQFLHPEAGSPYTKVRGVDQMLAVTHFVGMAGVGPDAPAYDKSDKRAGIFGYDRQTSKDDVKDGLSNTIYLIQVDAGSAGPWIAAGGATIRGTSEKGDDVGRKGGFVSPNQGDKKGVWIMMADGSTRYLTKDVAPEVFKALCTMAGGDEIGDLESLAPATNLPRTPAKPGAPAAPAKPAAPPKADPPKADPPKAEPKKPGVNEEEDKKSSPPK